MTKDDIKNQAKTFDDEVDLLELFKTLFQGKWTIVSITTFVSTIGVIYSLTLPNIYESKALLTPANSSSSISQSLRNASGLAGLAGISLLPSPQIENQNYFQAIQKLNSLSFFEDNILPNIFLPNLMALESWDFSSNTLNYNENIFNKTNDEWVRDYAYPFKQVPSAQESFEVFMNNHFSLNVDEKKGFVFLAIKHQSPFIAEKWADLIVHEVNAFYRQKDKSESERAVRYLNEQIVLTNLSEVKDVISNLLQEETKKLTLIEANKYYVFNYIDPPVVMEIKSEPRRSVICIIFALFGAMIGSFYVLIRHYFFRVKKLGEWI
jgi:LPS O-antigen subunit length determinant protein (WzzB/FepE family)